MTTIRTGYDGFTAHDLGDGFLFHVGRHPVELMLDEAKFGVLWDMHPNHYDTIHMVTGPVQLPRLQQPFGQPYRFSGISPKPLPVPPILDPFLAWSRRHIFAGLNGLLVNWYDAAAEHYIGPHRDSRQNMIEGAPIVTISLGAERVFRIRPWKKKGAGFRDFPATNGSVFIMPYAVNLAFTHEVGHMARSRGRRISVTLRAFHESETPGDGAA